jgi:hypothetical protein
MKKSWENDSCEHVKGYYATYTVQKAAMLWCGIPVEEVDEHLEDATPTGTDEYGRHVLKHPEIPCLEPRCRAIQDAIDNSKLKVGRDGGNSFYAEGQRVAYSRRTLKRDDLKEWMAKEFSNDKPAFLFDEIERSTHPVISTETYLALQAERDALKGRLEKAAPAYKALKEERDTIAKERDSLKSATKTAAQAEYRTLLKLIIGMAADAYGYDPGASYNTATGGKNGISARLSARGFTIGDDTVRKYLDAAKEVFPK